MKVYLLCNNQHGVFANKLYKILIGNVIEMSTTEPLPIRWVEKQNSYWLENKRFFVNIRKLNEVRYWDETVMPNKYVVKLLRYLRKMGWDSTVSPDFYPFWRIEKGRGISVRVMENLEHKMKETIENPKIGEKQHG